MRSLFLFVIFILVLDHYSNAQTVDNDQYWHNKERELRYRPEGTDIVIINGNRRFTRALYGTNAASRVEAGDLPEFALYMPGMGGNFKFGLISGDSSKWLIDAKRIEARYQPGKMIYAIEDPMLGNGKMRLEILALSDAEGMMIRADFSNVTNPVKLCWAFGGASGKKFSRDGDMGPDPESSFYLKPEYCTDNRYSISNNSFVLNYGSGLVTEWDPYVNKNFSSDTVKAVKPGKEQTLVGVFPPGSNLQIADATQQSTPIVLRGSTKAKAPLVNGILEIKSNSTFFFLIQKPAAVQKPYPDLVNRFRTAEISRVKLAERIRVVTPDGFINTLGGVLATAADAVWESPTYLHGAIGWRMRLNGWRGPYVADVLGWHDRAKEHFRAYSLSQLTSPATGPVIMDTALHLARSLEKLGTSVYSSGYICRNPGGDFRPHHYDMNLVYIDALLRHFQWTGDLSFAKEMWPVITRHLAWEKRNFDPDDDGLYDAYAAIWASDALEYSGGAVTHSSAYNYKANKDAALIAKLIGEDGSLYEAEAKKILHAINSTLWMPSMGSYAEFKDMLGNKLLHPQAAAWTFYHSIDSDVPDALQAYQAMSYTDHHLPHIPVKATGIENGYSTISTSNWMPYDWSLNNVATAEVMHTALANWQAGRNEAAFNLFKAELLSTMYLGGSPGNIGQISFYDAARGEAYRDFADPVAMTARSLVEGLFGIRPNALKQELVIEPGFPAGWDHASLATPDIQFDFVRKQKQDNYSIQSSLDKKLKLSLIIPVNGAVIRSLTVNGKKAIWRNKTDAVGSPMIVIEAGNEKKYLINIVWENECTKAEGLEEEYANGSNIEIKYGAAVVQEIADPQKIFQSTQKKDGTFSAVINTAAGWHTAFLRLKQNEFTWWQPIDILVKDAISIIPAEKQSKNSLRFTVVNSTGSDKKGMIVVNPGPKAYTRPVNIGPEQVFIVMNVPQENLVPGSNSIVFNWDSAGKTYAVKQILINWNIDQKINSQQQLDLSKYFNDKLTNIFENQYLSPRPKTATLQLPTQGIGDWTHPLKSAVIDDKGLRKLAGAQNEFSLPQGIRFTTVSDMLKQNIIFTSQWDNYPKQISIPLTGSASHAWLLMAGSTNPMQSRLTNAAVIANYIDGSADTLLLKNPENWWPIEQDYMDDGYAFRTDAPKPVRIHLKTGKIVSDYDNSIAAFGGKMIEGGAATVLDLPLNSTKTLKNLELQTWANDVVVGLMAVTLDRTIGN